MCRSSSPTVLRAPAPCTGRTSTPIDASGCSACWASRAKWLMRGLALDRTTTWWWSLTKSDSDSLRYGTFLRIGIDFLVHHRIEPGRLLDVIDREIRSR